VPEGCGQEWLEVAVAEHQKITPAVVNRGAISVNAEWTTILLRYLRPDTTTQTAVALDSILLNVLANSPAGSDYEVWHAARAAGERVYFLSPSFAKAALPLLAAFRPMIASIARPNLGGCTRLE
jgi:hypothetical protein